jgi:hypothetical protein
MIETILSIIIITLFVGTLTYILVEPGSNTKRSKLFDASTTDNAEDVSVVMNRAINGNIINGKSFLDVEETDTKPETIICPACKNKIPHDDKNIPSGVIYEVICPNCQCFIKLCKKS